MPAHTPPSHPCERSRSSVPFIVYGPARSPRGSLPRPRMRPARTPRSSARTRRTRRASGRRRAPARPGPPPAPGCRALTALVDRRLPARLARRGPGRAEVGLVVVEARPEVVLEEELLAVVVHAHLAHAD